MEKPWLILASKLRDATDPTVRPDLQKHFYGKDDKNDQVDRPQYLAFWAIVCISGPVIGES